MTIQQAYRYELDPNNIQRTLLARHAGAARFAWNWGLARRKDALERGERVPNAIEQHREWNQWKKDNAPWAGEVSKCAPQESLRNLDKAFANFWRSRKEGRPLGFPRFKKKGRSDGFRLTGSIHVAARSVSLPRLGTLRTKEQTGLKGRLIPL
jgi:putative transposase